MQSVAADEGVDFAPDEDFSAAFEEPFGPVSLGLGVWPLKMRLDGLSRWQAEGMQRRFLPFVVKPPESPDVRIGLRRAGVDQFLRSPEGGWPETYRLERRARRDGTALRSCEFAGTIEASGRHALPGACAFGRAAVRQRAGKLSPDPDGVVSALHDHEMVT